MGKGTVLVKNVEKFNELIIKNGLSYRSLAKKVNCSQTQISLILKGERNPSPQCAFNICEALNCKFDTIFFIKIDYNSNQKLKTKAT